MMREARSENTGDVSYSDSIATHEYSNCNVSVALQIAQESADFVQPNTRSSYLIPKSLFDIIASSLGIITTFPILLIIALAIRLEDPNGKALYIAPRCGKNGVPFPCAKLRSMYANADEIKATLMSQNQMSGPVFKIKDDSRVTRVDRFIRKTSIDELP